MQKIIFSDIDGTLTSEPNHFTSNVVNTLSKLKKHGIQLILCTGRPRIDTTAFQKRIGAAPYIISNSGSDVYDLKTKLTIYQNKMLFADVKKAFELAQQYDYILHAISGFTVFSNCKDDPNTELIKDIDSFQDIPVTQCTLIDTHDNIPKMKKCIQELQKLENVVITNQSKCLTSELFSLKDNFMLFVDICNLHTSKALGIEKLCNHLGINPIDTVAIGDGLNDIPMFHTCGIGIAMGNSQPEVKQAAKLIAPSNKEDGAVKCLTELFKIQ